jgi:hypothetical protein
VTSGEITSANWNCSDWSLGERINGGISRFCCKGLWHYKNSGDLPDDGRGWLVVDFYVLIIREF